LQGIQMTPLQVGIVMGSESDQEVMSAATKSWTSGASSKR